MASAVDDEDSLDQPTNDVVPSFSFSGCGFLGVYHIGVAACLREHTDVVSRREIRFAGASAGALVATTLLCDIDFGEMTRMFLEIAKIVRDKEPVDLAVMLRDVMYHYLPDDAHKRLSNRLYISMTILQGLECGLVTDFQSKEHLIDVLNTAVVMMLLKGPQLNVRCAFGHRRRV
ncbi:enzymatic polyprotein [Plakobranchus ocellatus]|uniref:Enzymatic polyprotein n=1 Tax=Plakobranchus ocellatus TaxID=259542 RepID=A0AAV3ZE74_9GAST|nr:enzymatic polyprotein [Plakobranchus ocellatus]